MQVEIRIKKLEEIKKNKEPFAHKYIHYKGEQKKFPVHEIAFDCLIYNQYNGRIATFVKTYEKQHGELDATNQDDEKRIARFLWDSKKSRNQFTQLDLAEKGQLEYGIVTADGVVIDGNRRFMLLKKNRAENNVGATVFKAIILEDTLDSSPAEIMRLETTYQLGADDKVDYSPIQKYLKCRDLQGAGFSDGDIAKMMGEKNSKINEWLEILKLMDEYLKEYGYDGMYLVLETQKLEGHFVDLNNYLSRYKGGRKIQDINWEPQVENIDDMKIAYFGYMRAGFGVHDIRVIANPAKDKGIFTTDNLWQEFEKDYFEMETIDEEKPLQKWREEHPETDIIDVISARDKNFREKTEKGMKRALGLAKRNLDNKNDKDEPLELLERAKKTLDAINPAVGNFRCEAVKDISHEIRKKVEEFIKIVEGKI